jgi:N-acetyltransferase 10
MKKKIDKKIKALIENAAKYKHRAMFIVVGDRGRDQIVNLHHLMATASVRKKPSILWCYKKELSFSSHRQKRMKRIKKMMSKGLYDKDVDDPFEMFITTTDIKYCYYKDTHSVLGNTFGMLVLQDFEGVTPNVMCRTMETVEGGGIIVMLFHTMTSLRQFYTISMDCHKRYRTESHKVVKPRFNERFLLSLSDCANCLVIDDELNVLPITGKFLAELS